MNSQRFEVPYKDRKLIGDVVPGGHTPTVLMLHGAGKSVRTRYRPLQDRLAAIGVASAVFDNIGHGETGSELESSSLSDRTEQAVAVIEQLGMHEPFGFVGGSMGAYIALKLSERYQTEKLALFVPGVYAADAYALPFGQQFRDRIRQKESWRETDAWENIGRFTGDLLIVTAEHDEVVPVEIPQTLFSSAKNARSRDLYEIPGSPHKTHAYLNDPQNAALLEEYLTRIQQFFQK